MNSPLFRRLPIFLAIASLVLGVLAGLARIGWDLGLAPFQPLHGPLMVGAFLGTLISMERAVALNRPWGYLAPYLAAIASIALALGAAPVLSFGLMAAGALFLLAILVKFQIDDPTLHTLTLCGGAALLLVANSLGALGYAVPQYVLIWAGFLILTIAGERLELSRVMQLSKSVKAFFVFAILAVIAGIFTEPHVAGVATVILAVWLLRFDVSFRTWKFGGITRFVATCLILANVWLLIGGILLSVYGNPGAGPQYDAALHAIFVGFVLSMIFGHAPVIFPAVAGLPIPYHPRFYVHLGLLHLSLVLRIVGDLAWLPNLRMWGALLSGVALLLFLVNTLSAVVLAKKSAA